jgi:hypothetical protein
MMVCACHPTLRKAKTGGSQVQSQPGLQFSAKIVLLSIIRRRTVMFGPRFVFVIAVVCSLQKCFH